MKTTRLFLLVALACFALLGGLLRLLSSPAPDPAPTPATPGEYETHCRLAAGISTEPLCQEPAHPCRTIRNGKTTEIDLDESFMILNLVPEETLLLLEQRDGWARVRVIDPDWLRDTHQGWTPLERLSCQRVEIAPGNGPAAAGSR